MGYCKVVRMSERILCSCSMIWISRSMTSGKASLLSPARSMLQYRGEKTLGYFRKLSKRLIPSLISWPMPVMILRNLRLSVWASRVCSKVIMGTPALIIVLNCLVNRISSGIRTGRSRSSIDPRAPLCSPLCWVTLDGIRPLAASDSLTVSTESASTVPVTFVPLSLMAW